MISGSGSANAAVVGTVTIPLMKRYGVPGAFAAAAETAGSMGGLIMPPMMGVGAFLMSDFLGVSYWEVVKRGFALAVVYYASIAFAIYLICVRLLPRDQVATPKVPAYDQVRTAHLLRRSRLPDLPDGLGRHRRAAGGALHGGLPVRAAARRLPGLQVCPQGPHARAGDAVGQHPARDRDARRHDVLPDAAARHARHHDRPVHGDRLHQPHGGDDPRPGRRRT